MRKIGRRDVLTGAAGLSASATLYPSVTPLRGLWRDEAGALAIGRFPEFGPGDFAFDYVGLRIGPLAVEGTRRWRMASTLDGSGAPTMEIDAEGTKLRVGDRRLAPVLIQRFPFEAVSGAGSLSAELATPAGTRPRGVIVMIYGSGPAPKEAFDPWAFWFLAADFAVLTYDKRGSGNSTGDWRTTGLEDLAADARTVIERARPFLPAGPLLAWGASQAGWIEPQLGAASAIDGMMMHAGSAMRPSEQILASVEAELRAYGFPEDEIDRAKNYYSLDTDVSRGRRAWEEIDAAFRRATAAGAEWILAPPAAPDAPERTMIRLMSDFDPAPYWRANRAPTLALFGGKDWIVPAAANLRTLESMTPSDTNLTSLILPAANHLMFVARTGVRAEYPTRSHIDPGYFSTIARWLDDQA